MLAHPQLLRVLGIAIGVLMVVLTLRPLIVPSPRTGVETAPALARSTEPSRGASAAAGGSDEEAVLGVVTAYNQASITAAVLNTAEPMAPYLAPEDSAWASVQAEYQRRARRGETHDPALTRWGVLRIAVNGDTATVETQEQWDDITSVGGVLIASKRGILTRNTYDLRRSSGAEGWRITTVASTVVVG
jgi:hypothetical protein